MPQLIFLLLIIAAAWYGYRSFKREATRVSQRVRQAEKEAQANEGFIAVDETHAHVHDAPDEHQARDPERGSDFLNDHVRGHLEQDVRYVVDLRTIQSINFFH